MATLSVPSSLVRRHSIYSVWRASGYITITSRDPALTTTRHRSGTLRITRNGPFQPPWSSLVAVGR
eukprot:3918750-Pyramimonas_sp.AAC.1